MTRVLYSFPHRIGAGRICHTAWQQAAGIAAAGADVTVFTGSVARELPESARVHTTLGGRRLRVPTKWLGRGLACAWHDAVVAQWLDTHAHEIDVFHGWPLGSLRSLQVAKRHGIRTFLERPNAHTAFAYEVVARENARIGLTLASGHDHAFNAAHLAHEEAEYALADALLCPSEFVEQTFRDHDFPADRLKRHRYGFDPQHFHAGERNDGEHGLVALHAGVCEPRKGLHIALRAWLESEAHYGGRFLVCGEFVPGYAEILAPYLAHPSVRVLGHRTDLPALMREADVFVLSSFEEGSALVTYEARASGCVLLVSSATGAVCEHGEDARVHAPGDIAALRADFTAVHRDRPLLDRLRERSLATAPNLTWDHAGRRLLAVYEEDLIPWRLAA